MNNNEYEKYQLELIAAEYRARGFEVRTQARVSGLPYEFDAVAQNREGEQVFIEIVNKSLSAEAATRKLRAFEEIAARVPNAKVDFRYIDVDAIALHLAHNRQQFALPGLKEALAARVPLLPRSSIAGQFLNLWQLHASTIRAFAVWLEVRDESNLNILDLYNEILSRKAILPPDDIVEEVDMDLFEIFDNVQLAIQGAVVEPNSFDQLRLHVLEVRRQVREKLRRNISTRNVNPRHRGQA